MDEVGRFVVTLLLVGVAVTLAGGVVVWFQAEPRRIGRSLAKVLHGEPEALLVAVGQGRGAAFNFAEGLLAVAWGKGDWCLIYSVDDLAGAELIIDGQVAARAGRGEARRALDILGGAEKLVRLRLLFDDAAHPDFSLDLWTAGGASRRGAPSVEEAVQEANGWLARTEALLHRSGA